MKVAIIECDDVPVQLRQRHGSFSDWCLNWLCPHVPEIRITTFRAHIGMLPSNRLEFDLYVVMGSRHSVLDDLPWLANLKDFLSIVIQDRAVLGLCFGHQLIHQALGGDVEQSQSGFQLGNTVYKVMGEASFMDASIDEICLHAIHEDNVVRACPSAKVIAGNEATPNAITTIGERCLTVQAHPEHSRELVDDIYHWRRTALGSELISAAYETLDRPTDGDQLARWVVRIATETAVMSGTKDTKQSGSDLRELSRLRQGHGEKSHGTDKD